MSAAVPPVVAPAPTNNYTEYRQCCAEQAPLPPGAWTFKHDPRYQRILEHVTRAQGEEFLAEAEAAAGTRWPVIGALLPGMAAENDRYGQPIQEHFGSVGIRCSPTNWRYLCHAVTICTHAESLGLERLRVVELGGGYGGLALYLHWLAPLWALEIGSYTIVDVPEAAALQAAYAGAHGVPLRVVNGLHDEAVRRAGAPAPSAGADGGMPPFLISAFAFSEFDADMQAWYRERLVRHCPHGLIVWNFVLPLVNVAEKVLGGPVYPFVDAPLTIEPERPETGPGNVVVTW